jgi:hypothetical protein
VDGTANNNRGIFCPTCGGKLAVSYGKDVAGGRDRVKCCAQCRIRVLTTETIKRMLPPTPPQQIDSIYRTTFGQDGITAEF